MSGAIVKTETVRVAMPARGWLKDLFASTIECRQVGKVLLQYSSGHKLIPLLIDNSDSNVTDEHVVRIRGVFGQGRLTIDALQRMAPGIANISARMSDVHAVVVSSKTEIGGELSKPMQMEFGIGCYLHLNLDAVLTAVGAKEQVVAGQVAQAVFEDGKTIMKMSDGMARVRGESGTIVQGYRRGGKASDILEFATRSLMPIEVASIYTWDKIIKNFGVGGNAESAVGEYEAELAIAKKLYDEGKLSDMLFDVIMQSLTGGYALKDRFRQINSALKSCAGEYLVEAQGGKNQFERDLEDKLKNFVVGKKWGIFKITLVDALKTILRNNRIALGKEQAAILALIVASGKITLDRAINFVSREPEKEISKIVEETKSFADAEENRIFNLRKVINVLVALAS